MDRKAAGQWAFSALRARSFTSRFAKGSGADNRTSFCQNGYAQTASKAIEITPEFQPRSETLCGTWDTSLCASISSRRRSCELTCCHQGRTAEPYRPSPSQSCRRSLSRTRSRPLHIVRRPSSLLLTHSRWPCTSRGSRTRRLERCHLQSPWILLLRSSQNQLPKSCWLPTRLLSPCWYYPQRPRTCFRRCHCERHRRPSSSFCRPALSLLPTQPALAQPAPAQSRMPKASRQLHPLSPFVLSNLFLPSITKAK